MAMPLLDFTAKIIGRKIDDVRWMRRNGNGAWSIALTMAPEQRIVMHPDTKVPVAITTREKEQLVIPSMELAVDVNNTDTSNWTVVVGPTGSQLLEDYNATLDQLRLEKKNSAWFRRWSLFWAVISTLLSGSSLFHWLVSK